MNTWGMLSGFQVNGILQVNVEVRAHDLKLPPVSRAAEVRHNQRILINCTASRMIKLKCIYNYIQKPVTCQQQ
jgi:hypothetical protein